MTKNFKPIFTITNRITAGLTRIERVRGFLEAACLRAAHRQATLSVAWVREMGRRALILEAHHTTHIEGTRLTLEQAERLLEGNPVPEADPDDVRELLNYRKAFEFVSEYLEDGLPAPRPKPGEFCIYVLKCADDSFYIGQTDDFSRRYQGHCSKRVSWTASRLPAEPIHWEVFDSREKALRRESDLKTGFGRKWLKREYAAGHLAGASRQAGGPITEGLVREIHKRLVEGVRGGAAAPGEYRKIQNYVVNSVTGETVYTPPPAHDVPIMMVELVDWLNREQEVHPVLVSGISQFQFVHVHPFLDGNGRTSRLLSTLCLYRLPAASRGFAAHAGAGYDFKRLFTISEYYDRNRPAFYRAIQSVRERGMDLSACNAQAGMTGWLEYFVEGLTTQLAEVRERGEQAIRRDVLIKEHRLSDRQAKALGHILEHGSLTIQDFEHLYPEVNRRSLQRDLKAMVDMGLLVSEGSTNKLVYRMEETG